MSLKDELIGKIPKNRLSFLRTGFDIIGDVAVIEIPDELERQKMAIAKAVLMANRNVRTVCRKLGEREGRYRLREMEILLGKSTETVHREYGCAFKLDVRKVYFSPREGTERQRVAEQVKPKETVMVMFAGVGPYAIQIAKKQPKVKKVIAIEINPKAVEYMRENITLNKVSDRVEPVLGDVSRAAKRFYGTCDRVVMPLPKEGYKFLPIAFACLKPRGGVIHFYHYSREEELFDEAEKMLEKAAKRAGRNFKITGRKKVLPYAPRVFKICLDAKVGRIRSE